MSGPKTEVTYMEKLIELDQDVKIEVFPVLPFSVCT